MKERLIEQVLLLIEQGKGINLMELELAKQYLRWSLGMNILGFIGGVALVILSVYLVKRARKMDTDYSEDIPFYVVGIVAGIMGCILKIFCIVEVIKIILYPKLFLLTNLLSSLR